MTEFIDADERSIWYSHPCTKELVRAIEARQISIVESWINGYYVKEHDMQVSAQGNAQILADIIEQIKEVSTPAQEQEAYSEPKD